MTKVFKPAKRAGTKNAQFRQRIDDSLLEVARGKLFEISFPALEGVKARSRKYKVGRDLAFTYGTDDPFVVGQRKCIAEETYKAFIRSLKTGVIIMSESDIDSFARNVFRFYKDNYPDTTGLPSQQKTLEALHDIDYERTKSLYQILTKKFTRTAYYEICENPLPDGFKSDDLTDAAIEYRNGTLFNWYAFENNIKLSFDERKRVLKRVDQIAHYAADGLLHTSVGIPERKIDRQITTKSVSGNIVPLSKVLDRWKSVNTRRYNTAKPKKTAIDNLSKFLGKEDANANTLSENNLVDWQVYLLKEGYAANSINSFTASITTLLKFAKKTGMIEHDHSSTFTKVRGSEEYTRDGYTDIQVIDLVTKARSLSDEGLKWAILLMINTGGRIGEVAQLGYDQVKVEKGMDNGNDLIWLDIKSSSFGSTVKVDVVGRAVPCVPVLINSDFIKFCRSRHGQPLFYNHNPDRNAASAAHEAFTKRTGRWIKKNLEKSERQDTHHAARHWFQSRGSNLDVSIDLIDDIVGHRRKGERDRYAKYEHVKRLEALKKIFSLIEEA